MANADVGGRNKKAEKTEMRTCVYETENLRRKDKAIPIRDNL